MAAPVLRLGAATISLLSAGALRARLADWLRLPETSWPPDRRDLFAAPISIPVQFAHISLAGRSALVDPCHPELISHSGDPDPAVASPPPLLAQLAAAGIDPAGIDTLVITHPHHDHYCGVTDADGRLLFPAARHLIGRADWEQVRASSRQELRALQLVAAQGRLEPVDGPRDLGDGFQIVPTPGETPGHQSLRVESAGRTIYFLGDLYHHAIEVERPEWGVYWADEQAVARSRAAIIAAADREGALLHSAHIPGIGRLVASADGYRLAAADETL